MERWEHLSLEICWDVNRGEIQSAYSGGESISALSGAGMAALARYIYTLDREDWESIGWEMSADGLHEVYRFKRMMGLPVREGGTFEAAL